MSAPGTVRPCPQMPQQGQSPTEPSLAPPGPREVPGAGAAPVPLPQEGWTPRWNLGLFLLGFFGICGMFWLICHLLSLLSQRQGRVEKIRNKRISSHTVRWLPVFGCTWEGEGSAFWQTRTEFFLMKPVVIHKLWLKIIPPKGLFQIRLWILVFCRAALGCKPHIWITVILKEIFDSSSSLLLILNFHNWGIICLCLGDLLPWTQSCQ